MGGPDIRPNLIWLCPTAHANVHEILRLLVKLKGDLSWGELGSMYDVPVSRYAFDVAVEGYRRDAGYPFNPIPAPRWAHALDGHVHVTGQLHIEEP